LFLIVLAACHKDPAVTTAPPVPELTPAVVEAAQPFTGFSAEEEAAIQALSPRDPNPACADVAKGLKDPTASFARLAEQVQMPPWVSIRAAACMVERAAEPAAEGALLRWVSAPEWAGLGLTAVNLLDLMPEEVAARVAAIALEGPIADKARDEIAHSTHAQVRALAED
jgi:hypothetical protein